MCELTTGNKTYNDVKEKIRNSGEHICKVFDESELKIGDFKCIYLGKYKNSSRVNAKAFTIPGFHRNDIMIKQAKCNTTLKEIL